MSRFSSALFSAIIATILAVPALAQAPAQPPAQPPSGQPPPGQPPSTQPPSAQPPSAQPPPPFATTKVEGTDNVYIFRYGGHQSMFVVTPQGVIATDPIAYLRPQAAKTYIEEIQKITKAPIRYVIYSHHHYDHIAGGKPFKDLGARFIAHKNARARLAALKYPDVVIPDQTVDQKTTLRLGGTALELIYVGRNHSDNSLVMRLPKEKIIFTVDFIPIQTLQFRNIPDNASPIEFEESLKKVLALDWERMIPGHPYAGGRLGTKKDVEEQLAYLQELSAEVKKAADAGKCIDAAMREIKLPKYESWANYGQFLPMNVERYCYWWGRGF
jgi:glyoxylase-like metal-dependent hydrolase (beta-lactamase superfamily II)